ncbi:phage minor head protein [Jeongeupia wiesaeckerbachi]|uniref:phage head morphogenesis protein n=1 Tax=Jeongeupia wiesaeckerbachi TaxID=3051218 RepID=UPI003D8018D4
MAEIDLAYCMRLPPRDAIAYLQRKGFAISWDWEDTWHDAQATAFTVAKATRLDILQDIRDAVQTAIDEGKTLAWFEKELTPVLQAKGWWGKQELADPATGEVRPVQLGSAWRLRTIYRVNVQTAYMAGRFQGQLDNVDDRPYWQYSAILDGLTRPSHRALHGKVFRYDDPFWAVFYPSNGFGCRCRVIALSEGNVARQGLKVDASGDKLGSTMKLVSGRTGEYREVATYTETDPATGKKITISPDIGWSYNPGAAAWQPDLQRYTGTLAELARGELGDG